jgi:23S rRNA pseudouridine1911/1915/1917 synthase
VGAPLRWTWLVSAELAGRADRAIAAALEGDLGHWEHAGKPPRMSRSQVQRLIDEGAVTIQGAIVRASTKLSAGAVVRVEVPEPKPLSLAPENLPIEILYQDEHLLVVNKPAGLTVHPSATQPEGTLVHRLLHHVKDLSGIGGALRPGIVHRLDKDTSGALLVTKTDAAHAKMVDVFSRHAIERRYWALVYGSPDTGAPGKARVIESTIGRALNDRKKMAMDVKGGRRAVTRVRRIEEYAVEGKAPFAAWVECELETGRTHQVRVHLTGIHHSLLGDPVYGVPSGRAGKWAALPRSVQQAVEAMPGQALHARVLGFEHPVTGAKLRFEAEPPAAFRALHEALRRYRGD